MNPNWVDWSQVADKKYRKKLIQPLDADAFAERLTKYFEENERYNIYSLSLFVGMSTNRFENNYLKSDDKQIAAMSRMALDMIAGDALTNSEEYKSSLRYIIARTNTGKDFIELSDDVKEKSNQVIILPSKN